jgi:hypothetical protein
MQAQIIKAQNGFVITCYPDGEGAQAELLVCPNLDKLPEVLRRFFGDTRPQNNNSRSEPLHPRGNATITPIREKARQVVVEEEFED